MSADLLELQSSNEQETLGLQSVRLSITYESQKKLKAKNLRQKKTQAERPSDADQAVRRVGNWKAN